jgi:hypothetical protein
MRSDHARDWHSGQRGGERPRRLAVGHLPGPRPGDLARPPSRTPRSLAREAREGLNGVAPVAPVAPPEKRGVLRIPACNTRCCTLLQISGERQRSATLQQVQHLQHCNRNRCSPARARETETIPPHLGTDLRPSQLHAADVHDPDHMSAASVPLPCTPSADRQTQRAQPGSLFAYTSTGSPTAIRSGPNRPPQMASVSPV